MSARTMKIADIKIGKRHRRPDWRPRHTPPSQTESPPVARPRGLSLVEQVVGHTAYPSKSACASSRN